MLSVLLPALKAAGALRVVAYCAVHVSERLALVGAALSVLRYGVRPSILVTLVLAALVILRTVLSSSGNLTLLLSYHRAALDRLLAPDVDINSSLANRDAQASILDAIEHGARLSSTVVPGLLADGIATLIMLGLFLVLEPIRILTVGFAAMIFAFFALLLARRVVRIEAFREWDAYGPIVSGVATTLGARLELVANGVNDAFRDARHADVDAYAHIARQSSFRIALANRFPIASMLFVVGLVLVLERSTEQNSTSDLLAHATLFGAALPSIVGLSRGLLELGRAAIHFAPLASLLDTSNDALHPPKPDREFPQTSIEWRDVSFRYTSTGQHALHDVRLQWPRGSIAIFRGPNGSGKSTLLRTLLAIYPLEHGEILCDGVTLSSRDLSQWRKRVAYLPQRPFLPPRSTVRENFRMFAPNASTEDMDRMLDDTDLRHVLTEHTRDESCSPLDVPVDELSIGERQRVAIARILLEPKKDLVLFDEPDANLDRAGVIAFVRLAKELVARGRWVAIAAHTDEVVAVGNLVVDLENGQVRSVSSRRAPS